MVIRHLPHFVVVAEEQHFQRASQRLNVAQSALSRRIRDLETELGGVPLFVRMPTGVHLTPSGQALLEDARQILAKVEEAKDRAVRIMNGEAGLLRIGYSIGAVRHPFIADLFKAFRTAFPKVALTPTLLTVEQLTAQLRSGDIDAAIFYTAELADDFACVDIGRERFVLAMPADHPLAGAGQVLFADIADQNFVWYAKMFSPTVHDRMLDEFARRGAVPRIAIESPTADTTLRLVASGLGMGFVPPVEAERLPAGVCLREVADLSITWHFRMVWLRSSQSAILPRLIEAVLAAAGAVGDTDGT